MIQLNLSPEDKLVLYCSRIDICEDVKHKIEEILNNNLDWKYIINCCVKQGISPLFYWNLSRIDKDKSLPYEVVRNLEEMYYSNLARNVLFYDELGKVLTAFKRASVDAIVLKGAFLAEEIYKNIGLRSMTDIDLLIKEEDLQKVEYELTKLKYSAIKVIFPTKLHEKFQTVWTNELQFIHEAKKIIIEIHWGIQPPQIHLNVDINKFWENSKPTRIAGIDTLTLSSEDLLQYLCLHLQKHLTSMDAPPAKPLRDYCDIAGVTKHYEDTINWNLLLQSSKSDGIEDPVFQNLLIASRYFGAFIPENIILKLETVKPAVYFEEIFNGTIKETSNQRGSWDVFDYFTNLKKVDGTWNKICILFGNVFPSKEFIIYSYSIKNEKCYYFHYLTRINTVLHLGLSIFSKQLRKILFHL